MKSRYSKSDPNTRRSAPFQNGWEMTPEQFDEMYVGERDGKEGDDGEGSDEEQDIPCRRWSPLGIVESSSAANWCWGGGAVGQPIHWFLILFLAFVGPTSYLLVGSSRIALIMRSDAIPSPPDKHSRIQARLVFVRGNMPLPGLK